MTRGTFILVCEDGVLESKEFNGGMSLDDYGTEVIIMLSQVEIPEEFEGMVSELNRTHYRYHDEQLVFTKKDFYDAEDCVDFRKDYFGRFFSDYLFIKSLKTLPIQMIDADGIKTLLPCGGLVVFQFGREVPQREIQDVVEKYYKSHVSVEKHLTF